MPTQPDLHECDMARWPTTEGESWTCPECDTTWRGGTVRQLTIPENWHAYDPKMLDAFAWSTSTGPSADWDGVTQGCGTVSRICVSGDWT